MILFTQFKEFTILIGIKVGITNIVYSILILYFILNIEKIEKLFTTYGYEVRYFYNLNKTEILDKVGRYSCKEDSGSLICFISSHGDQTSLACPDGEDVQIFVILKKAQTKQLEKCPKVFFFDACRKYYIQYLINIIKEIFNLFTCCGKAYCNFTVIVRYNACQKQLYISG